MPADRSANAPLALQLEVEFLDRLSEPVRDGRARSVSAIIRAALARFDFANVVVVHPAQLQISVRVPPSIRRTLRKVARARHTSIGQLVRAAVESYLPHLEAGSPGQLEMPIHEGAGEGPARVGAEAALRKKRGRSAARATRRQLSRPKTRGAMTKKRKG